MAKRRKKSPGYESGGARLKRKGRIPVQIGMEPDDVAIIDQARGDTPRTRFITRAAVEAARAILRS